MAKAKAPANTGKVPSKTGAKHDANAEKWKEIRKAARKAGKK